MTTKPTSLTATREQKMLTWWYLTASYDEARSGWAAQDFLTIIPSP